MRAFKVLLSIAIINSLPLNSTVRADTVGNEGDDWAALHALEKRNATQADAALRAKSFLDFYRARSKMHANIGAATLLRAGDLYLNDLKQPEEAIKIFDGALNLFGTQPSAVLLLEAKARALLQLKRPQEVAALLQPQLPLLLRAGQGGDSYHIQMSAAALRYLTTPEGADDTQTIALLQRWLRQAPVYLEDRAQGGGGWHNGWMYERLIDTLIKAKRHDEALAWAKRYFQLCAFDKKSIESATTALGRVWAARDDLGALNTFLKAQQEAAAPNPLRDVPLPVLDAETRAAYIERIALLNNRIAQGWSDNDGRASRELMNILIAQGDKASLSAAFEVAKNLLKNRPDRPEGAQEMCRLFKAIDLHSLRANAFIAYLDGQGQSPLPALLQELE